MITIDTKTKNNIVRFQVEEMTAYEIYTGLAKREKNAENKKVLSEIANAELRHYKLLQKYSNESPKPRKVKIALYVFFIRVFGELFAIKLMETSERLSKNGYEEFTQFPELVAIAKEEEEHEEKLINMINEEKLYYMGSIVLGLNDALVEFTGALAGFTLALNNTKLIALTGAITGIAAALSMGSSEYVSTKSEESTEKKPVKAAVYTTVAYLITVFALIAPFVLLKNALTALFIMLGMALLVIAIFNFYYAVVRSESFVKRFREMAILSFSVAGVSFLIGYLLRKFTGIEA